MEAETILSQDIRNAQNKAHLDVYCKRILGNKRVLAWIMRECLEEYRGLSVEEIEACIEGTPEISSVPVMPGETNTRIRGSNTEDAVPGEGTVYYDIRFVAVVPRTRERIRLLINLEGQNDPFTDEYSMKRSVYYVCRMVSSQHGTEFENTEYEKIRKVYSIWVFFNPSAKRRNTITQFRLRKEDMVGTVEMSENVYDLIRIIHINLGTEKDANYEGLLEVLGTLFSRTANTDEKRETLKNKFGFAMTRELREEVTKMCNYSEGVWQSGHAEGHAEGRADTLLADIVNVMEAFHVDPLKAMSVLRVPEDERENLCTRLKRKGYTV